MSDQMKNFSGYFPFLFPFLFVGWGAFVLYLIALLGGWRRLSERYPARLEPVGKKLKGQSARIGLSNYGRVLTIVISPAGFYLVPWGPFRFAHPPLLIPWRDIYNVTFKKFLWTEYARFEVSIPPFAVFQISRKVLEEMRPYLEPSAIRN